VLRKGWQGGTLVPDSSSYVGMIRVKFTGSVVTISAIRIKCGSHPGAERILCAIRGTDYRTRCHAMTWTTP